MQAFLGKFAGVVRGVLSGLDRVFLSGRLRGLAHTAGLRSFLWNRRVLLKDFGDYCQQVSTQVHEASLHEARHLGREIRYLNSGQYCKEDIARAIAARELARPVAHLQLPALGVGEGRRRRGRGTRSGAPAGCVR